MENLRVAAIQMRSGISPERNARDMADAVADAAGQGAKYIQTPEMTGIVQKKRSDLLAQITTEDGDVVLATAVEAAIQHGVVIHLGSTAISLPSGKVANRGFVISPRGDILGKYDKIHMFDVDLDHGESWCESAIYQAGSNATVVNTGLARVGIGICYDIRFPELFRQQALAGAEILTAPAAFTRQTGRAHWHVLQRARAIENGAYVISAAQGGDHEDGRETYGHSVIIDPWGTILAEAAHEDPDILIADLDLSAVQLSRAKIPNLKNARDFDISTSGKV